MHPVLALGLGVVGVVAIVRWCAKEVRRVNSELDHLRAGTVEPVDRDNLPKLKPDPKTGEYRPG